MYVAATASVKVKVKKILADGVDDPGSDSKDLNTMISFIRGHCMSTALSHNLRADPVVKYLFGARIGE